MVNNNVLSCLLKDGKEVNAVMLGGRLFHARATVTQNDRSPMVRARFAERSGMDRNWTVVDAVIPPRQPNGARQRDTKAPCGYDSRKPVRPVGTVFFPVTRRPRNNTQLTV